MNGWIHRLLCWWLTAPTYRLMNAVTCDEFVPDEHYAIAHATWQRLIGLMGVRCQRVQSRVHHPKKQDKRPVKACNIGAIFLHCRAVHTRGMRVPLDLMFLDHAWRVCTVMHNVPPGSSVSIRDAAHVVERVACKGGSWKGVKIGDAVMLSR